MRSHPILCARCGATFWVSPADASRRVFCSRSCRTAQMRDDAAATLLDRFWATVDRTTDPRGCWPRSGAADSDGYVYVKIAHRTRKSHRVALELAMGRELRDDEESLHTCDNPACVRNDEVGTYEVGGRVFPRWGHLWLGTGADNMADKVAKERGTRGASHGRAKLTETQVTEILTRHRAHEPHQRIAADYGVSVGTIERISGRRGWKHLPLPSGYQQVVMARGETHHNATVTEAIVREMRERHGAGESMSAIARRFGVSLANVSLIVRRLAWKHVS